MVYIAKQFSHTDRIPCDGLTIRYRRRYTVKAFFFIKKNIVQVPQAHYKKRRKFMSRVKNLKKNKQCQPALLFKLVIRSEAPYLVKPQSSIFY